MKKLVMFFVVLAAAVSGAWGFYYGWLLPRQMQQEVDSVVRAHISRSPCLDVGTVVVSLGGRNVRLVDARIQLSVDDHPLDVAADLLQLEQMSGTYVIHAERITASWGNAMLTAASVDANASVPVNLFQLSGSGLCNNPERIANALPDLAQVVVRSMSARFLLDGGLTEELLAQLITVDRLPQWLRNSRQLHPAELAARALNDMPNVAAVGVVARFNGEQRLAASQLQLSDSVDDSATSEANYISRRLNVRDLVVDDEYWADLRREIGQVYQRDSLEMSGFVQLSTDGSEAVHISGQLVVEHFGELNVVADVGGVPTSSLMSGDLSEIQSTVEMLEDTISIESINVRYRDSGLLTLVAALSGQSPVPESRHGTAALAGVMEDLRSAGEHPFLIRIVEMVAMSLDDNREVEVAFTPPIAVRIANNFAELEQLIHVGDGESAGLMVDHQIVAADPEDWAIALTRHEVSECVSILGAARTPVLEQLLSTGSERGWNLERVRVRTGNKCANMSTSYVGAVANGAASGAEHSDFVGWMSIDIVGGRADGLRITMLYTHATGRWSCSNSNPEMMNQYVPPPCRVLVGGR